MGGISFVIDTLALLHRSNPSVPFKLLQTKELSTGKVRNFRMGTDEGEMEDMPPDVDFGKGEQGKRRNKKDGKWGNYGGPSR